MYIDLKTIMKQHLKLSGSQGDMLGEIIFTSIWFSAALIKTSSKNFCLCENPNR